jgi:hypothetical protein
MSEPTPEVTPELIRAYARWTGLILSPERAAALGELLAPLLRADRQLAALNLNLINPVGPLWPEEPHEQ